MNPGRATAGSIVLDQNRSNGMDEECKHSVNPSRVSRHCRQQVVKFDHHVGSLGLRFLFHSTAGSRFGTRPPHHRSARAFGFVSRIVASSHLFGAAASPRPLSGVPTPGAGVRTVASSRLLEGHAPPGSRT